MKHFLIILSLCLAATVHAQVTAVEASMMASASAPYPRDFYTNFLSYKLGVQFNYGMSTFLPQNTILSNTFLFPIDTFNPVGLSVSNIDASLDWCVSNGISYVGFNAMHFNGFKLWRSTNYFGINDTAWGTNGGGFDIAKTIATDARARGLKVSVYMHVADIWYQKNVLGWTNTTGNGVFLEYTNNLLHLEQLTAEMLNDVGPVDEIWRDGWSYEIGYVNLNYFQLTNYTGQVQPGIVQIDNSKEGQNDLSHTPIVEFEAPYFTGLQITNRSTNLGEVNDTPLTNSTSVSGGGVTYPNGFPLWMQPIDAPDLSGAFLTSQVLQFKHEIQRYNLNNANAFLNYPPLTNWTFLPGMTNFWGQIGAWFQTYRTNDYIARYKFSNNLNDSSGNDNTATLVGTPSYAGGQCGSTNNRSIFTDGTSGTYVTIPGSIANNSLTNFTINLMVFAPVQATDQTLAFAGEFNKGGYYIDINTSSDITIRFNQNGTSQYCQAAAGALHSLASFEMMTFVCVGGTNVIIYTNGIAATTTSNYMTLPSGSTHDLWLGAYDSNGSRINGLLSFVDDFSLLKRALTSAEIYNIFTNCIEQ